MEVNIDSIIGGWQTNRYSTKINIRITPFLHKIILIKVKSNIIPSSNTLISIVHGKNFGISDITTIVRHLYYSLGAAATPINFLKINTCSTYTEEVRLACLLSQIKVKDRYNCLQ